MQDALRLSINLRRAKMKVLIALFSKSARVEDSALIARHNGRNPLPLGAVFAFKKLQS